MPEPHFLLSFSYLLPKKVIPTPQHHRVIIQYYIQKFNPIDENQILIFEIHVFFDLLQLFSVQNSGDLIQFTYTSTNISLMKKWDKFVEYYNIYCLLNYQEDNNYVQLLCRESIEFLLYRGFPSPIWPAKYHDLSEGYFALLLYKVLSSFIIQSNRW